MSDLERSGSMIGFGLVTFLSFLFARSIQVSGDTINVLAVVGGSGFVTLCYGFYLLIVNRKDLEQYYTDEYKLYRASEEQRKKKQKLDSDEVLRKYQSMPDLEKKA